MNGFYLIKNVSHEGGALIEVFFDARNIPLTVVDLQKGEPLPPAEDVKLAIVMGGPDSANDTNEKIRSELTFIEELIERGTPYFGVCLGMQLLAKASGASVIPSGVKEVGFRDTDNAPAMIDLTDKGEKDPLFQGISEYKEEDKNPFHTSFRVFHLHGETLKLPLPDTLELLARGDDCEVQVIKVKDKPMYGIQSHCEITAATLRSWHEKDAMLRKKNIGNLLKEYKDAEEELYNTMMTMLQNLLRLL